MRCRIRTKRGTDVSGGSVRGEGQVLTSGEDYFVYFTPAEEVPAVSAALEAVSEEHLHAGYLRIDPEDYGMPLDDEDWQYTREYFDVVRDLWRAAAEAGRAVIFTVDA